MPDRGVAVRPTSPRATFAGGAGVRPERGAPAAFTGVAEDLATEAAGFFEGTARAAGLSDLATDPPDLPAGAAGCFFPVVFAAVVLVVAALADFTAGFATGLLAAVLLEVEALAPGFFAVGLLTVFELFAAVFVAALDFTAVGLAGTGERFAAVPVLLAALVDLPAAVVVLVAALVVGFAAGLLVELPAFLAPAVAAAGFLAVCAPAVGVQKLHHTAAAKSVSGPVKMEFLRTAHYYQRYL